MLLFKHFFNLMSFTVVTTVLAAPYIPDLNALGKTHPAASTSNAPERNFYPSKQCNDTQSIINSVQADASAMIASINDALGFISQASINNQTFGANVTDLLSHIDQLSSQLSQDLSNLKWPCVTSRMVPDFSSSITSLFSDLARLLLQINQYAIFTGIHIDHKVWDTIFGAPKLLVQGMDKVSDKASAFNTLFGGSITQVKQATENLCGLCTTCSNPFA